MAGRPACRAAAVLNPKIPQTRDVAPGSSRCHKVPASGAAFASLGGHGPCGKEGVAARGEPQRTIGLGCLGQKAVRSKMVAECLHIEEPNPMNLMAPTVGLADSTKCLNIPEQSSFRLVFGGFHQYGPILA